MQHGKIRKVKSVEPVAKAFYLWTSVCVSIHLLQ